MNPTDHYYEQFAAQFFDSTVTVDMSAIHQRFMARLTSRAHVLDAGCGSGRDAKAFTEAGFQVTAFDASAELARMFHQRPHWMGFRGLVVAWRR